MAKSDLLKEAIADARAVKETALANAKIALQEAFVPRITSMLEQELEKGMQEPAEGEEEEMGMEVGAEEGGDVEGGDDEGVNWIDNDISFSIGDETYDYEISEPGDESEVAAAPVAGAGDEFEEGGEEEEDLNLESLIRELEMDADAMGAETMSDEMTDEGMDYASEGMYEGDEFMSDMPEDETNESYIDEIIESILREEDMAETNPEDVVQELEATKDELADAKDQVQEAYRTVRYLKNIINEVNLLNAKLLYTNKLFRNFELNEGQKMKVIENFDRAGTTREVKLVFTTLAESFKRPTKKRVVRESYASRPVASTAPRTAPILNEGFEMADRWKKLAGLL
jgi:hypothetical protein